MPAASEPIVVNTGPLLALQACEASHLLVELHATVLVPDMVLREILRGGEAGAEHGLRASLAGAEIVPLTGPLPPLVAAHLDPGEAAVLGLALERGISLVAIDEKRGRLVARSLGLRVTGSIGILLRAKRLGLIARVGPRLEAMRAGGVWLNPRLLAEALREAGE
jgi:predicted nucleic acid-binding protein